MIKKRFISILALLFGLLPCMSLTAYAASVSYVDGNGTSQTVDATELESTTTSWTDGSWYIVPEGGLTISGRIAVSGTVNLILRDGTELTASAGITNTNATLNIYAQSTGTGALTATGANGATKFGGSAGIGGIGVGDYASGGAGGTVNIYGGTVTATGGNGGLGGGGGAGIGGGGAGWQSKEGSGAGGTVNIYGGTVTATGGTGGNYGGGGAGIGGGGNGYYGNSACAGGTVNIYGGTVTATGGTGGNNGGVGAGIGGGGNGHGNSAGAGGTLTLGVGAKLYNGTDNTGTVLDDNDSESRNYSGSRPQNMYAEVTVAAPAAYTVTLKEGTEDATSWTIAPAEATTTGVAAGTEVTASYGGVKKVKSVKAKKKAPANVPVESITLNKTATEITVGQTETLSVTSVLPEEATDKTYTWKTSDETKATVDQDGKVTAVAAGTVNIYAEANDGSGVMGNCTVTVTPATITVTWNNDDITGSGNSFTKDGVTITADFIDFDYKDFWAPGTFSTDLGNFTKIEVTAEDVSGVSGTGWSGSDTKKTWTGNASSVSFSGDDIFGISNIVFTIEPTN